MPLDATPGGPNANSYLTSAEADNYWATRLFSDAWNDADSPTKDAALEWATRLIDAVFNWTGKASTDTQALCWPRTGMSTRNGYPIADNAIPNDLKSAVAEFAGQLLINDRTEDNDILKLGLSSLTVGPISMAFKDANSGTVELRNTDIIKQWPQLAYVSQVVPDAVRWLLPASWYVRELLTRPIIFTASR